MCHVLNFKKGAVVQIIGMRVEIAQVLVELFATRRIVIGIAF